MPRFKVNPDRSSGISPITIPLYWLRCTLKRSPPASAALTGLYQASGSAVSLEPALSLSKGPMCCPVYASAMSFGRLSPHFVSPKACRVTEDHLTQHLEFSPALQTVIKPTSFITATLGKGGWLVLTLQGLTSCQIALSLLAR